MSLSEIKKDLAQRDILLRQIELQIKNKEKFIADKSKELEKNSKTNSFLKEVNEDYRKHYHLILDEKKKQKEAMDQLQEYVKQMIESSEMLEEQVEEAERDQREIIHNIEKIKKEIENLTN